MFTITFPSFLICSYALVFSHLHLSNMNTFLASHVYLFILKRNTTSYNNIWIKNNLYMYVFASNKFMYVHNILFNLGFKNNVDFHNVYHNARKYICKLIYRKKIK